MEPFDTLSQAIHALRAEGYTEDFNLKAHCLECQLQEIELYPEDFVIDKVYRFFGPSDPDDESILYAISSEKYGLRGLLVNAYGVDADTLTQAMVEKLK